MKIITLLFLTFFLGKGCESEKKQEMENTVIEYTANTRGFYQKITIKNQMVSMSEDRTAIDNPTPKKITDGNWNILVTEFKALDLKALSSYKAPTEKRFYDGAAIADLLITYKDSTYSSASFDHGDPPVEIVKLVNIINAIAKEQE